MNTVLDDSKILCLPNGERIKLKPSLKMIFEVQDLPHASPSTISRCGVVYIEPGTVEYENMVRVFLDKHLNNILP